MGRYSFDDSDEPGAVGLCMKVECDPNAAWVYSDANQQETVWSLSFIETSRCCPVSCFWGGYLQERHFGVHLGDEGQMWAPYFAFASVRFASDLR